MSNNNLYRIELPYSRLISKIHIDNYPGSTLLHCFVKHVSQAVGSAMILLKGKFAVLQ